MDRDKSLITSSDRLRDEKEGVEVCASDEVVRSITLFTEKGDSAVQTIVDLIRAQ
jgi:hypothetical protein